MTAKKKEQKPAADEGKASKKPAAKKADKPAKEEGKKAKKELPAGFGPREIPEGHTGLAALAEAAGRTPAAARRILRANEVAKPEGQHGWYWKDGSKDLKAIEKLLTKEEAAA